MSTKIRMKRSQQLVTLNTKKYDRKDAKRHPNKRHLSAGKEYTVTDDELIALEGYDVVK